MNTFGLHTQVGYAIDTNLPEEVAQALIRAWFDEHDSITWVENVNMLEGGWLLRGRQIGMYSELDTYVQKPDDYLAIHVVHRDWNFC